MALVWPGVRFTSWLAVGSWKCWPSESAGAAKKAWSGLPSRLATVKTPLALEMPAPPNAVPTATPAPGANAPEPASGASGFTSSITVPVSLAGLMAITSDCGTSCTPPSAPPSAPTTRPCITPATKSGLVARRS